jgi:3-oxoacyl-[acyl-carrier protein] reductase
VKHLVITGGEGTLAKAVAEAFVDPCWQVAAPPRGELDVTRSDQVSRYFHGRSVDLLVCAAGATDDVIMGKLDETTWERILAINYQGAATCTAAVLPEMIRRGVGHVLFISSRSAIHPPSGQAAYATAKAALLGLTTALAREHGGHGIRVNAILPGFLETQMTRRVTEGRRAQVLADHALGRFNTSAAVAKFIRHLHEELPHTSGQVFQLDSRIS